MENIQIEINKCSKCGVRQKLTENSIQMGKTPFIIIGESPAKDGWIESKRAFFNTKMKLQASGRILEKLLNIIGYTVDDIYFTECCKCIIDDRKELAYCSQNCLDFLKAQLDKLPCNIILTMGLHPTQAILQTKIGKFADYVGKHIPLNILGKNYTLIPIYHTSPLNPKGYKENVPIFENLKQLLDN